jgi:amino-acid N-acetyltransferase
MGADKLLILSEGPDLRDPADQSDPRTQSQLTPNGCWPNLRPLSEDAARHLRLALRACQSGVRRVHRLGRGMEGALLLELFTRDGVGTLITADTYEGVRPATIDDVGGILELIRPLESRRHFGMALAGTAGDGD